MAETKFTLKVKTQLLEKLKNFPQLVQRAVSAGGQESAKMILGTTGLKKYPPATQANLPPPPYYIRGLGMQTSYTRNAKGSERYGSRFATKSIPYRTLIENTASYAEHLGGEKQASHMAKLGWRRLIDVAREKVPKIVVIYNKWLAREIKRKGL